MLALTAEWANVIVGAGAAAGTIGAVLVALFGPAWREKRRRPSLQLVVEDHDVMTLYDAAAAGREKPDDGPAINVVNATGKDVARDVEVLATVLMPYEEEGEELPIPLVERETLLFNSPSRRSRDEWQTRVPPGFGRRVYFVLLGARAELFHSFRAVEDVTSREWKDVGQNAALAAYPPTRDNMFWLADGEYIVELEVTGANFDALSYRGRFAIETDEMGELRLADDEAESLERATSVKFTWVESPKLI